MRQKLAIVLTAVLALSLFAPAAAASTSGSAAADAAQAECEYPIELTDATGETITLEESPESVVALQASDAQTMFEIGAEGKLVGMPVEDATSGLEQGDRVDITDNYELNHERVVDLDPDLVLAAGATNQEDVDALRDAGLTVYHFEDAESLDDVRDNVLRTGELTGECDGATETVDWMDEQLEIVETALEDVDRPLAYYELGGGITAGTETFNHEVLTAAGLENVAERAEIESWEQISTEFVLEEDPEWILYPDDREEPPIADSLEATTAYQNDNVIAVDANRMNQPAPQVVYAVVDIVEAVHPDAYEAASAELDDADEGNDSETNDDSEADDEDEESIPGFGIPAAVAAALVATGFLARRR